MQAYRVIAKHPRKVARLVAKMPNSADSYYLIRAQSPIALPDVERAARFLYLNRNCFNGVYRTNKENEFNVPRGTRPGLPLSEAEVVRCSYALRSAILLSDDFTFTVQDVRQGDFVYLDPPYLAKERPSFGEYGYGSFGISDIDRLIETLNLLDAKKAHVLLSYTADEKLLQALSNWSIQFVKVRRQVAGGNRPNESLEILAANYALPHVEA